MNDDKGYISKESFTGAAARALKEELDRKTTKRSFPHEAWASAMRKTPGEWKLLDGLDKSYTTVINSGGIMAYRPSGLYEARSHNNQVYARWLGGSGEPLVRAGRAVVKHDHAAVREQAESGEWIECPEFPPTYTTLINAGRLGYGPAGAYKTRTKGGIVWVKKNDAL